MDFMILLQSNGDGAAALFSNLISLAFVVVIIASFWVIFAKAGEAGWQAIIPIWNYIVMLKIVGRPMWWIILAFIPVINIIVGILVAIDLAKSFGHGAGFGIGLAFLGIIFYPILAFGSSQYIGPAAVTK